MKHYCIWIVSIPGYIHSRAFQETAFCLKCAFRELGHDVPIVHDIGSITDHPIILGANLLVYLKDIRIPPAAILYNLEQIQEGSAWVTEDYLRILRSFRVWDYSTVNVKALKKLGVTGVRLCRIGYMPGLTNIAPAEEDIDILFYGCRNERRMNLLEQLRQKGCRVEHLMGVFGEERDRYIARARIVLNIHFYESKVFEIIRVLYLLANKKCVISETGSDRQLEEPFGGGVVFSPYEDLVYVCLEYLENSNKRAEIANRGFTYVTSLNQVQFLREALEGAC